MQALAPSYNLLPLCHPTRPPARQLAGSEARESMRHAVSLALPLQGLCVPLAPPSEARRKVAPDEVRQTLA
eukprot:scaffold70210_cov63-Phaeocystis_antarctica.AAC.3